MSTQTDLQSAGPIRKAWFAYIGALSRATRFGIDGFRSLVREGETVERQGKQKLGEAADDALRTTSRALNTAERKLDRAEDQARSAVESTLSRVNVATGRDTRQLKRDVGQLSTEVERLVKPDGERGAEAIAASQPVDPIAIGSLPKVSRTMADKLDRAGINDTAELLAATATATQRRQLADTLSVTEDTVLGLAHRADFARIKGIGAVYAELLERTGVTTVKDLATRNAESLREMLESENGRSNVAGRIPPQGTIEGWITQANALPRILTW